MQGSFTFTAKSVPECESFLQIRWPDEEYLSIEQFITLHPNITRTELDKCTLRYRAKEEQYFSYIDTYVRSSQDLKFVRFNSWQIIMSPAIRASVYFTYKAADCLQNARFFLLKSKLIIDSNENMPWANGYLAQYSLRCLFFGTAATWYSNTFDQLLQSVYWAYELYTSAVDRKGNTYDNTWDAKKMMSFCTYEFVVGELKKRNLNVVRKLLTTCYGKIEEVRCWANYIKHKGGIEYLHLTPESPLKIYVAPAGDAEKLGDYARFEITNFKSPVEIDIDEKITVLECTHKELFECITAIIAEIDYCKYLLQ